MSPQSIHLPNLHMASQLVWVYQWHSPRYPANLYLKIPNRSQNLEYIYANEIVQIILQGSANIQRNGMCLHKSIGHLFMSTVSHMAYLVMGQSDFQR